METHSQSPALDQSELRGGMALVFCTVVALLLANSPWQIQYREFWSNFLWGASLKDWINEGLMSIFFLFVGLEIKREFLEGELASPKKSALPILAALGGMLMPALIFFFFNHGTPEVNGWGIPMATDIAFAVGVLSLFGRRVPLSLKIFLMALAIVDDLGAVVVIAFFYTHFIHWKFLFFGLATLGLTYWMSLYRKGSALAYLLVAIFVWVCFLKSGVHVTIAGVLIAMIIPLSLGHQIQRSLHSWVTFGIIPLFALANAGVSLGGTHLTQPLGLGILGGLIFGKPIGIFLFSWLGVKSGLAVLPSRVNWKQLYGVACLGGIGFTMSIFISQLAFPEAEVINAAKLSVLVASGISVLWGSLILAKFSANRS